MPLAISTIFGWIKDRTPNYVCVRDVHGIICCQKDTALRSIHNNAGLVTPDGIPLVWLARQWGYKNVDRVYGPDLMLEACKSSVGSGYRHYLYGGKEGVPEILKHNLELRFPGIKIVGTYSPPYRELSKDEDKAIVEKINKSNAEIVWVGLSTPKQERWMANHVGRLQAPALIGVGAAFDFHAGMIRQAPLWMQNNGVEWIFRLIVEPRRLWKRYLTCNTTFIYLIIQYMLGLKQYSKDWEDA